MPTAQPTTRFLPYSVFVNTAGGTDAWINQIESAVDNPGVALYEESSGSEVDTLYVAEKQLEPVMDLASSDLSALTTFGFGGVFVAPGSGTPGVTVYGRALPQGSLPGAIGSSLHMQCLISDGMIIPESIVCGGNNDEAKINFKIHGTLGTTATYSNAVPFLWTTAQTITSGQAQTSNIYTGGPCKFTPTGGSAILAQGITSKSMRFGIKVLKDMTDSLPYPNQIAIIERKPKFEFTTHDPSIITTIGDGISVSAFAGYFRNVAIGGQRIAPATTSHVSIAGTGGMITPGSLNLSHKKPGEASFLWTPSVDGSGNPIIVVSVTAAIPTT